MIVRLRHKKTGREVEAEAVYNPTDLYLEVRPERTNPMAHHLSWANARAFLAGEEITWSYTYFAQLVTK